MSEARGIRARFGEISLLLSYLVRLNSAIAVIRAIASPPAVFHDSGTIQPGQANSYPCTQITARYVASHLLLSTNDKYGENARTAIFKVKRKCSHSKLSLPIVTDKTITTLH